MNEWMKDNKNLWWVQNQITASFFLISIHLNKEIDRYPCSLENDWFFPKYSLTHCLHWLTALSIILGVSKHVTLCPAAGWQWAVEVRKVNQLRQIFRSSEKTFHYNPRQNPTHIYVYYILHCLFSLIFLRNVSERMCVIWLFCYCCSKLPHHKKELKLFKCKGL